jgi:hypothetical protein
MSGNQDKEREFEKFLDHQIKLISEYFEGEEMFKSNLREKFNKVCQINILNKEWLKKWKEIVCFEQVKEKCKKFNNSKTKDNNLRKEISDLFKKNNSKEELEKLGKMEFPNNIKGKTYNEKGNNILFNENINFIPVISNYCNYLKSNIENIFVSGNFNKGKCFLYNQIKDKKVLILEQKKDNNDEFDALMVTLAEKEDIKTFINKVKNKTFEELMKDKNLKSKIIRVCQINILNKEWIQKWKEIVGYEQIKEKCKKYNNSKNKILKNEIYNFFYKNNSKEKMKDLYKMNFQNFNNNINLENASNILFNDTINFIPVISNYCNYLKKYIENIVVVSGFFVKGKFFLYNEININKSKRDKIKEKKVLILEKKIDSNNDEFNTLMISLGEKEDI